MLVKGRMSKPVITVEPSRRIMDAMAVMKQHKIRRMPVIDDGKLVGIVSDKDLLDAGPSDATSLSVWEINYLLSKLRVEEVMTRHVLTVQEDTPIEEAARIMADKKVGGLPVMRGDELIGIITETDLFKNLLELLGGRRSGVRLAVAVPAKVPKEIQDKLAAEIRKAMQDPEVQRKIEEMGFRPVLNSNPETFTAEYKQQLPKWAELVKISGAKLD